nr:MAG TPA: hypothetical protein [Caudoviricetes sp.]
MIHHEPIYVKEKTKRISKKQLDKPNNVVYISITS